MTPLLTDARPARLSRIGTGPDLDLVEAVGRLLLLGGVGLDHPVHSLPKELVVQLQDDRVQHAAIWAAPPVGCIKGCFGSAREVARGRLRGLWRCCCSAGMLPRPAAALAGRSGAVRAVEARCER